MPKMGANTWLVGTAVALLVFLMCQRLRIVGLQHLQEGTTLECPLSTGEAGTHWSSRSARGGASLADCIGAEWRPALSQNCIRLTMKRGFRYSIRYTQTPEVGFSVCMEDLPMRYHWSGSDCGFVEVREEPKDGAFWFWRKSPPVAPAQYVAPDPDCVAQATLLPTSGWELP